jgi:hypothetical protein
VAPELLELWSTADGSDVLRRWVASVAQRRWVLRHHGAESVLRRVAADVAGLPPAPPVSVVLSTRRTSRLSGVLRDVAAFDYPRLQLVVGLHLDDADEDGVRRLLAEIAPHVDPVVVSRSASTSFGAVLGDLTARADGALVTKVDDDDRYGRQHVWDLVLARGYSGAVVVGKPAEFVYLEDLDTTVRRASARSEEYGTAVAGGTMLMARGDLDAVGGWRPVAKSVDRGVLDRVLRDGGLVYSTHGLGYVYVRHSSGHTWEPEIKHFLNNNLEQWDGRIVDPDTVAIDARPPRSSDDGSG